MRFLLREHAWWLWVILLLPVVFLLPAFPIDETRYLAVAWEMHHTGNYLVPHLNGETYSHKPPLLFWLINASWSVMGIHVWSARFILFSCSVLNLVLVYWLAYRLTKSTHIARNSVWILVGMVYFSAFSVAIMFDMLLTCCVLAALHGVLDLHEKSSRRGILLLALGTGLGILAKGPVVLLDIGFVIILGIWWSDTAKSHKSKWYIYSLCGVIFGIGLALLWAIPAASSGGKAYADAIFLHQTVNRMSESFAHRRSVWWYFTIFPLMILPWLVVIRAPLKNWRSILGENLAGRFVFSWVIPAFIAFSFISGKQPHYLLPLLPGVAVGFALLLNHPDTRLKYGVFSVLLCVPGLLLFILSYPASHIDGLAFLLPSLKITQQQWNIASEVWPIWGVTLILIALLLACGGKYIKTLPVIALMGAALPVIGQLAITQALQKRLDLRPVATEIAKAQQNGIAVGHLGWHHGLYTFAGRLTQPLEKIDPDNLQQWCLSHKNGWVVSYQTKYRIDVPVIFEQPFRFGRIAIWRAQDLLAMPQNISTSPAVDEDDDEGE